MGMKDAGYIVFFAMFVMHVLGDWVLQPKHMIDAKQKKWWDENYPGKKHEKDYLIVCFVHGFFWSTLVHVPIIIFRQMYGQPEIWAILASGFLQGFVHMGVDCLNANRDDVVNFTFDQWIHNIQIIWTYIMCIIPFAFEEMFDWLCHMIK